MPHVCLTIDGHQLFDAPLDTFQEVQPETVMALLDPRAEKREPWSKPLMMVLWDAIMSDQPTAITIASNGSGWVLDVEHTL
jgi:hypothetical protein